MNDVAVFTNKYLKFVELDDHRFYVKNHTGRIVYNFIYEPQHKIMIHYFIDFIADEDLKEIFYTYSRFCGEKKLLVLGSVTDISQMNGSFDGISDWMYNDFIPNAMKYGYRFDATIEPQDFFVKLALEEAKNFHKDYETRTFKTIEEGHTWLVRTVADYLKSFR